MLKTAKKILSENVCAFGTFFPFLEPPVQKEVEVCRFVKSFRRNCSVWVHFMTFYVMTLQNHQFFYENLTWFYRTQNDLAWYWNPTNSRFALIILTGGGCRQWKFLKFTKFSKLDVNKIWPQMWIVKCPKCRLESWWPLKTQKVGHVQCFQILFLFWFRSSES